MIKVGWNSTDFIKRCPHGWFEVHRPR